MTNTQLKLNGIEVSKIDNGYRVSKTIVYSRDFKVITLDKEDHYGIKVYMLSINDEPIKNVWGKTLYWNTKEEAEQDIIRMLYNKMPENGYTFA